LNISGHHVEVTPALKDYVSSKLERLDRHHDKITGVDVTMTVDKMEQKVDARVFLSGADFFADAIGSDMYAAIDLLVDKLDRQLIRHKEKLKSHR